MDELRVGVSLQEILSHLRHDRGSTAGAPYKKPHPGQGSASRRNTGLADIPLSALRCASTDFQGGQGNVKAQARRGVRIPLSMVVEKGDYPRPSVAGGGCVVAAPPTPPGIRVTYLGGSIGLSFNAQCRCEAGRANR